MYGLIFDGLEKWVVSKLFPQGNDDITRDDDERGRLLWEEILRATVVLLENEWSIYSRGDFINSERQAERIEQQEGLLDEDVTQLRAIIDDDGGHFVTNQKYSDQLFHALVKITSQKLNSGVGRVLEEYGYFFLDYIRYAQLFQWCCGAVAILMAILVVLPCDL